MQLKRVHSRVFNRVRGTVLSFGQSILPAGIWQNSVWADDGIWDDNEIWGSNGIELESGIWQNGVWADDGIWDDNEIWGI